MSHTSIHKIACIFLSTFVFAFSQDVEDSLILGLLPEEHGLVHNLILTNDTETDGSTTTDESATTDDYIETTEPATERSTTEEVIRYFVPHNIEKIIDVEEPIPHHVLKYAAPPHNIHFEGPRPVTAEPKRIVQIKPVEYSEPKEVPLARRRLQLKQNYASTEAPPGQLATTTEGREETVAKEETEGREDTEVVDEVGTEASQKFQESI